MGKWDTNGCQAKEEHEYPICKRIVMMKGKARVSHLANKKMKTLLHMSALVAVSHNNE